MKKHVVTALLAFVTYNAYSAFDFDNYQPMAFVSAYNMRFFDNMLWYSPTLHEYYRVIDEDFYRVLGI